MTPEERERLGEVLIDEGIITQEEIQAFTTGGGALGAAFDGTRHVKRVDLGVWLAADYKTPTIDDLRKIQLNPKVGDIVPSDLARKYVALPIAKAGGVLVIARGGLYNRAAIQELRKATGLRIKVIVADEAQIMAGIEWMYGNRAAQIPEPRQVRKTESVAVADGQDNVPLFSMVGDNEPAPTNGEGVLVAIKVSAQEFAEASHGSPYATWDNLFSLNKPVAPIRVG